ncbi:hypothetical protein KJ865_05270, partial [Myxococcota bacterium]|nr:hypothetical protein [Myxococcota bacterium]
PTYAVIALFTLVKERHFRLVRRIPGFRSAMSAGYRFSTLRGLQGHGYESWDGMMDALEILRTGKVIAYADAHPRFSVPFTKALHKLRTGICADYARGRRTGFHGVPVTLSGLRWFVDVAVHGEPALERARNPDELASRLDRLRHYLPGEVVSRWESRLGEWLCELLADQHDLEALAERLETPWNMLSPAAQIMWRTRLGELAVDGLSGEPDFYVLAQRYDKLRRHLPDAVRGAWLDRLLELGDQANFRTLITVIHVFLEGESEERRRAFKELQHRKARTIDDLQWLRKDCDEFVDLQLDAVRQEAALTFDARALSSLARELHRLGGDETEVREWFQRALEIADLGGKRAVASKVMETLRDKRWGHAILREIGDLRPMPSKV